MKVLTIKMPDGSTWACPVNVIAEHRAAHYAHQYKGGIIESLRVDTEPLFEVAPEIIEDWAANNMNWADVSDKAFQLYPPPEPDYQEGWMNGEKSIILKLKQADDA